MKLTLSQSMKVILCFALMMKVVTKLITVKRLLKLGRLRAVNYYMETKSLHQIDGLIKLFRLLSGPKGFGGLTMNILWEKHHRTFK